MARTNSFTIKASLTALLVLVSFFCFYISYSDFVKINNEYAYIYDDFPLFLLILNAILMSMVLGLTFIVNLIQPYLERGILYTIL